MKKFKFLALGLISAVMVACGTMGSATSSNNGTGNTGGLGGILDILSTPNAVGNVISSVIGANKVTEAQLIGNWKYYGVIPTASPSSLMKSSC